MADLLFVHLLHRLRIELNNQMVAPNEKRFFSIHSTLGK